MFIRFLVFLTVLSALLLMNCTSSLPILEANVFPKHASVSARTTLKLDSFYPPITKLDSIASEGNGFSMHNYPLNFDIGGLINPRLEMGGGLLGYYAKYLLVKPERYDKFALSNMAVSAIASAHFAMGPGGHLGETESVLGFLIGVPLCRYISLSTGILASAQTNGISSIFVYDTLKRDSLTSWDFSVRRIKIILPINLLAHFGDYNLFAYANLNIPLDIYEKYESSIHYYHGSKVHAFPSFENRTNYEFRFGLGQEILSKKKQK